MKQSSDSEFVLAGKICYKIDVIDLVVAVGIITSIFLSFVFLPFLSIALYMASGPSFIIFCSWRDRRLKTKIWGFKKGSLYEIKYCQKVIRISEFKGFVPRFFSFENETGYAEFNVLMHDPEVERANSLTFLSCIRINKDDLPIYLSDMVITKYGERVLKKGT